PRSAVAGEAHAPLELGGSGKALRRDARDARGLDGALTRRDGRWIPGEGHGVSGGDGGARPIWRTVPRVRHSRATHSLRRQRDELLRALSDGRTTTRRPCAVEIAEGRLAQIPGRARRDQRVKSEEQTGGVPHPLFLASRSSCLFPPLLLHPALLASLRTH